MQNERVGRNAGSVEGHDDCMGIVVHPGRLRLELARRGWCAADLAREAGVSHPTVSAVLAGRPIAARSLGLIGAALERVPPAASLDRLVFGSGDGAGVER